MFLSDVSIKRPVFATMLMVALLTFGLVSYTRLAIDEYPDITYPTISVNTSYPGASPEVMERDVSRPIEEALNTVQGIREVTSTSQEGQLVRPRQHAARRERDGGAAGRHLQGRAHPARSSRPRSRIPSSSGSILTIGRSCRSRSSRPTAPSAT